MWQGFAGHSHGDKLCETFSTLSSPECSLQPETHSRHHTDRTMSYSLIFPGIKLCPTVKHQCLLLYIASMAPTPTERFLWNPAGNLAWDLVSDGKYTGSKIYSSPKRYPTLTCWQKNPKQKKVQNTPKI